MSEWVSVDELLPEIFELVIIQQVNAVFTGTYLGTDSDGIQVWESGNGLLIQPPELWQPLPLPRPQSDVTEEEIGDE